MLNHVLYRYSILHVPYLEVCNVLVPLKGLHSTGTEPTVNDAVCSYAVLQYDILVCRMPRNSMEPLPVQYLVCTLDAFTGFSILNINIDVYENVEYIET